MAAPLALTGTLVEGVSEPIARGWTVRMLEAHPEMAAVSGRGGPRVSEASRLCRAGREREIRYETLQKAFHAWSANPRWKEVVKTGGYRYDWAHSKTGERRMRNVESDPYTRRDVDSYARDATRVTDPYDTRHCQPE